MNTDLHVVEIVAVLRLLTAQLVVSETLDEALNSLAGTATDLVDGQAWCGVTVIRTGEVSTAASSHDLPILLDKAQLEIGEGPCLEAIRSREMLLSQDLENETRWQQWSRRAFGYGVRGVLSLPVNIDDQVLGALNIYAGAPDRFPPSVELTAMLLAEHAGLLVSGVLDRSRLASRSAELTAALGDGEAVNRAIGIVMAQRSCTAEDALDVLRAAAETLRIPLAAVAERLVDTVASRAIPVRRQPQDQRQPLDQSS